MSFGRDVRGALFRGVTAFSAADVNTFGASSLITRITNDVQQVQMLVVMIVHALRRRADHDRRRPDPGASVRTAHSR